MLISLVRVSYDIIQIILHYILQVVERKHHGPLKTGSNIFKAKGHLLAREGSPRTNESCLLLVFWSNFNLVIPQKTIMNEKIFLPMH